MTHGAERAEAVAFGDAAIFVVAQQRDGYEYGEKYPVVRPQNYIDDCGNKDQGGEQPLHDERSAAVKLSSLAAPEANGWLAARRPLNPP